jgi:transcriptional regulator with XRE-family HTH domain
MGVKLARGVKGVNNFVKDFSQAFSQRLRELRGTQSKSAFGRFLGIPNPSTYHNYERGRVPDSQTVSDIAQRCSVTVDWLLGRDDALPPQPTAPLPAAMVREAPAAYGQAGQCRYPEDCDLPGQIRELREDYAAMQATLAKMAGQIETVTGLLGNALAPGLGNAHSDAHRKYQPRKAG